MIARRLFRTVGALACVAACAVALAPQASASGTHLSSRCATFRVKGTEYGVYIAAGHVRCSVATGILKAVDGGKGKIVNNGNSANSYVLYRGWLCPFGNMGEQTCEHSNHPVNNPRQDIASLACAIERGCPVRAAFLNE
ncbi:MAG TPA: hypothetical protein VGL54_08585 [Solirubrobacteraceae bacterium]|jgi:hypothetical protein